MPKAATTGEPLRVLFVEDSADDTELSLRALRRGGFAVEYDVVQCEEDFRRCLQASSYDVVLSDNSLPRWSGSGVLETARATGLAVPVVLVTGSIGEEAAVDMIRRGAFDYILKDRMMRLPDAVRRAIAARELKAEQRRALKALEASERRLRAVIDHEPECVKLMDADGHILEMNTAGLRMIEADDLPSVVGRCVFPLVAPEHRDAFVELTRGAWRGEPGTLEFEATGLKGTRRRLHTKAAPMEIEGRTVVLGITRDITEQRLMERKIQTLEKFEAIGKLAGGIAHDFNNILGAVMGWAELGSEAAAEHPAIREHFRQIQDQASRAASLTRQLLAFARRQIIEPRALDLNHAIKEVTALLRNLIGERVELQLKLDPQAAVVRADPAQVEQVLMNLCVNARDAMPDGGTLTITTELFTVDATYQQVHSYAKLGAYVRLCVADTGVGMDAETLKHIFEPFFTTKDAAHGTGLGLPTVYGIVHQHDGFVNVYSEPGHGSIFRVYWPAIDAPAAATRKDPQATLQRGTETILVAEDHEGLRRTAVASLEMLGYKTVLAVDGEKALELLHESPHAVDLLLLDVVMPKKNGPEVYALAKKIRPDVPVIFSTGYGAESTLLKDLIEKENVAVLQKPYSLFLLGERIREVLDRKRGAPKA